MGSDLLSAIFVLALGGVSPGRIMNFWAKLAQSFTHPAYPAVSIVCFEKDYPVSEYRYPGPIDITDCGGDIEFCYKVITGGDLALRFVRRSWCR